MGNEKFCGRLVRADESTIGNIYKTDAGYIVREIKEYARKPGGVLFNGRVFTGKDFAKARITDLGYGVDRSYTLRTA
jgi:hypothetical protein